MKINYEDALNRLKSSLNVSSDAEVAECLGMTAPALSYRKKKDTFPTEALIDLIKREPTREIDLKFVLTGELSNFEQINRRFKESIRKTSDMDVIQALGIKSEDFIKGRLDDLFPIPALFKYAQKRIDNNLEHIDVDYIISGKTATVNQYGLHLIEMLEKLATLSPEEQLNIIQQVNNLYHLHGTIKHLENTKKQL